MAEHNCPRRRRLRSEALQATRSADPIACQAAQFLPDVRRHGCDSVVVVGLDSHDARLLRSPKPDGEHCSERDRHLPEDVSRLTLADDALDSIDELDRLDPTLEHGEERSLVARVRGVLARAEADIGRNATKPFAVGRLESREHRDPTDLVRRHHSRHRRFVTLATGQR